MDYFQLLRESVGKDTLDEAYHYLNEVSKEKNSQGIFANMARMEYTTNISWMSFDRSTINWIVSFLKRYSSISEVFEIGAGNGFFSALMNHRETQEKHSFNWWATDPMLGHGSSPEKQYSKVEELDASQAVSKYGPTSQMMTSIWPSYNESWAGDAIKQFRLLPCNNERFVLYGGESEGGMTGDDAMFEEFDNHWTIVGKFYCPQWLGIHDYLTLYICNPSESYLQIGPLPENDEESEDDDEESEDDDDEDDDEESS